MKNQKSAQTKKIPTSANQKDSTVKVLYQKMGDRWFAFSTLDDDVFVGSISQEEIDFKSAQGKNQGPDRNA